MKNIKDNIKRSNNKYISKKEYFNKFIELIDDPDINKDDMREVMNNFIDETDRRSLDDKDK